MQAGKVEVYVEGWIEAGKPCQRRAGGRRAEDVKMERDVGKHARGMMGGCRGKRHWDFPWAFFFFLLLPLLLLPCFSEWVVGREERESLCKSRTAAHHLNSATLHVSLTRPRTPLKKAAHSVSKSSWGRRVFIFVCGAHQSFKLFKRYGFWQVFHWEYTSLIGFYRLKPAVAVLFVEQEALTYLPFAGFLLLLVFTWGHLTFFPFWRWDPVLCRSSL